MTWATRFRVREYLRESLWVVPLLGALTGVLGALVVVAIDRSVHLPPQWQYSASTASTVLSAIVGAMAALTGFVVTVTVLVVQMVTGTFSARCMRLWYRDRVLKGVLALLIATLAFSFSLLRRIETNFVPDIGVTLAGFLVVVGLVMFMLFFNRFIHRLRPVAVAADVAKLARGSLGDEVAGRRIPGVFVAPFEGGDRQPPLAIRCKHPGAIQAVNLPAALTWARQHECLVVMRHFVGEFLDVDDVLIEVYGNPGDADSAERTLRGFVALGIERTIEQDPAFAIRVMVDVANKALSAAINDPTTAVQVLNYLGDSLRMIGTADLLGTPWHPGAPRRGVVVPFRRWEDFLALGVTEIREYGSSSIQVMRRMRAMLERLSEQVRVENRAAVQVELARVDATIARSFSGSIDRDRAGIADRQGIGGPGRLETVEPAMAHRIPPSA
ncbi:MAG: DUF2254 domain-containing protein [Solirubrobacteraceae bacterium]